MPPTPAQRAQARRIARELATLGFALPGTLADRKTRCGRANCRCHADPPALHGPYHQWTRKKDGKTATRILSDEQLADYGPWFDNHRRLRQLITELEELSLTIAAADPRWNRLPAKTNVVKARLTRGQHPQTQTFPQLRPKREDLTR